MSTKISITWNEDFDINKQNYHLYLECLEKENIYLTIDNPEYFEASPNRITVKIPQEIFKQIAKEKYYKILKKHTESLESWEKEET